MAAKQKVNKPLVKVEELEDDASVEETEETKTPETKSTTPVVSSFSQLDSAPPAPAEIKNTPSVTEPPPVENVPEEIKPQTVEDVPSQENPTKEQISSDEVKEWLKEVRPDTTKEVEKVRGSGSKFIVLIIIILLILGAVVGGIFYFQKGVSETIPQVATPTETPTEAEAPVAIDEEEEIDYASFKVSVLNGSGIAGEAGKVKDLLVDSGFAEDNIATGNADSYDYQQITASLKSDLSEKVIGTLESALSDDYEVEISKDELQENSTYDIVIIVGK